MVKHYNTHVVGQQIASVQQEKPHVESGTAYLPYPRTDGRHR